jgi:hypothetical protein
MPFIFLFFFAEIIIAGSPKLRTPVNAMFTSFYHPENYMHSSAGFYYKGIQGIFIIDDMMQMMDIDLSKRI